MKLSNLLPKLLTLITILFASGVSYLALQGKFKYTIPQIGVTYPTLLTPIVLSYYIHLPIFVGFLILSVFQLMSNKSAGKHIAKARFFIIASMFLHSLWVVSWCNDWLLPSAIALSSMVFLLSKAFLALEPRLSVKPAELWLVRAPINLFFGWTSFLTLLNWSTLFQSLKWKVKWLTPELWAISMLIALSLITLWLCLRFSDLFFILAIVWGFIGIALRKGGSPSVSRTVWLSIFVMALVVLVKTPRKLLEES